VASTYLSLYVHIIFATKDRAPTIDTAWRDGLHAYLAGTMQGLGAHPHAIGGTSDHVHILTAYKATQCVADLVRETKKASAAWACGHYELFRWQTGYGAFSLGPERIASLGSCIASQEEHHRTVSSADELRALLAESGIPYDERYFD
jgi:putative transposase